jgi:hypothetical protein
MGSQLNPRPELSIPQQKKNAPPKGVPAPTLSLLIFLNEGAGGGLNATLLAPPPGCDAFLPMNRWSRSFLARHTGYRVGMS